MAHSADLPATRGSGDAVGARAPADDLADVWAALDALPPASAGVDLAATTVDLVAAKVANDAGPAERQVAGPAVWGIRIALVAAALVAGLAAGRSLAPDPDQRVLEQLPLIEHVSLLREAGSVPFLEAVADRMTGRQGPPRWMRVDRGPENLRTEARQFDEALVAFETEPIGRHAGVDVVRQRRQRVEALPATKRDELERSVEEFESLSSLNRRELVAVAQALRDPGEQRLRDAARTWHVLLAAMNPVFRRSVVEMSVSARLEVIDRWPDRFEPRPPSRPREDPRDRRPAEGWREFDGPGPRPPRGNGFTRPEGFPGRFTPPPPFRPAGPPPAGGPREVPAETPAPPR